VGGAGSKEEDEKKLQGWSTMPQPAPSASEGIKAKQIQVSRPFMIWQGWIWHSRSWFRSRPQI